VKPDVTAHYTFKWTTVDCPARLIDLFITSVITYLDLPLPVAIPHNCYQL